jgi:hypothetical protein
VDGSYISPFASLSEFEIQYWRFSDILQFSQVFTMAAVDMDRINFWEPPKSSFDTQRPTPHSHHSRLASDIISPRNNPALLQQRVDATLVCDSEPAARVADSVNGLVAQPRDGDVPASGTCDRESPYTGLSDFTVLQAATLTSAVATREMTIMWRRMRTFPPLRSFCDVRSGDKMIRKPPPMNLVRATSVYRSRGQNRTLAARKELEVCIHKPLAITVF